MYNISQSEFGLAYGVLELPDRRAEFRRYARPGTDDLPKRSPNLIMGRSKK
jgi:hypothetical protein